MRPSPLHTEELRYPENPGSIPTIPAVKLVPALVAERAATAAKATAIVSDSQSITYEELDRRSNQMAHRLRSLGVGPEVITAICLERSVMAVTAALAVLKAGGAYLPLDCSYPADRLAFILDDARPAVVITESSLAARGRTGNSRVINVDKDLASIENESAEPIYADITGETLAYVIYTSGSTGQPKGVQITHSSLSNLVTWHLNAFGVTAADRATQLSSFGFDAAVWELWPHLVAGASLYIVPDVVRVSAEALRDWLVERGITISFVPTALAERLILMDWPSDSALRFLLTGADTLHHYPSRDLPFALVNNYGPTETTVVATSGTIAQRRPDLRPPIGQPITNTTIHILDDQLHPVPRGEIGEIHVGGAGVARGYLNRPELTQERFIPSPFNHNGARLYKTGDLAKWLPDGQVAYIGRADEQIKIRGFRIEPNEIVSVLNSHPRVKASAVVTQEESAGVKRLLAYIVSDDPSSPGAGELRNLVRSQLPDYMLPTTFVRVDELPITTNGKLDREALPLPDASNMLQEEQFVAPRTPLEERVTAIIAKLLGLERVGVNENFFLIGGHSLLGTQLIARVRDAFGVDLSLRSIFDLPTPAQLAKEIENLMVARLDAMSAEEIQQLLEQANVGKGQR